jgi:hypothetical protein
VRQDPLKVAGGMHWRVGGYRNPKSNPNRCTSPLLNLSFITFKQKIINSADPRQQSVHIYSHHHPFSHLPLTTITMTVTITTHKTNTERLEMKEITNTYTLNMQPTPSDVLNDIASSDLLIKTMRAYLKRDTVDALKDIEVLHALFTKRCDDEMTKDKVEIENHKKKWGL